jgi:hypothetical protein
MVVYTCNPSYSGGRGRIKTSLGKVSKILYQKQDTNKIARARLKC